jgi:alpha/beta superfamily hydrolase
VQREWVSETVLREEAAYFAVPGAHLYTMLHRVTDPVARVLLVGPFASERHFGYHTTVRWARYLSARGIEVLRYDHRGVGESTGAFRETSFDRWMEDLRLVGDWLSIQSPQVPLLLHGIEIGAILAARYFHEGDGDALLLWSPPANANQVMRSTLLRWAGLEQVFEAQENRRTVAEYIRQLEQGGSVEVLGYEWTSELWRDSFLFGIPDILENTVTRGRNQRPVRSDRFGKDTVPIALPYPRYPEMKDLGELYSSNFHWIADTLMLPGGTIQ